MSARIVHYTQNPLHMARVREFAAACLASPEFMRADSFRADAVPTVEGASAFLARELQQVSATTYDVLNFPSMARQLVPFSDTVAPGATSYAYDQWELFGAAEFKNSGATDPPLSSARKKRFSFPMRTIWLAYMYTLEDLQAAQFAGQPLSAKEALANRIGIEQKIDDLISFGDSTHGMRGLAGQTDFTAVSPVTGSWSGSTTAAQLFGDLNKLALASDLATGGTFKPDTLVLPLSVKPYLTAPWSTTVTPTTIEQAWLATQAQAKTGITKIEYWKKLDLANAGGTGGRALCYQKSKLVLEALSSYDYQEFPSPSNGLIFLVTAQARMGGLAVHYPLACSYMDIQ
jgi:hypothetical protein